MGDHVPRLRPLGRSATTRLALAAGLIQSGRYEPALDELELALSDNPELPKAHLLKGLIMAQRGELAVAALHLETAARLDDHLAPAWLGLAWVHRKSGDATKALKAARRAVTLAPSDAAAHAMAGQILADAGRSDEAVIALRRAVSCDPGQGRPRALLGELLGRNAPSDDSLSQLLVAARLNPQRDATAIAIGDLLATRGDLDGAMDAYKLALQYSPPRSGTALARLGKSFLAADMPREALFALRAAIRTDPRDVAAMVDLARVYLATPGCAERAREMLQAALEVDPSHAEAKDLLAKA